MEASSGFVLFGELIIVVGVIAGRRRCFDDWPVVGQGLGEDVLVLYGLI